MSEENAEAGEAASDNSDVAKGEEKAKAQRLAMLFSASG